MEIYVSGFCVDNKFIQQVFSNKTVFSMSYAEIVKQHGNEKYISYALTIYIIIN